MNTVKSMLPHRASHNPTKRVPGSVIKPVEKVVEPMIYHIMCGSVVKPEIDGVKIMHSSTYGIAKIIYNALHWVA